ncbi:hypothetical protein POM88_023141 [Heracleum sosnowskyi]|uniref:Uncharacterized protein n=1 Tax=Heracleum sosnowskyi TaxID=360622 RepID=A0AAD8II67_9APIA|nr:hypothetical protein POM88_023141 [Heracleum sosnowskyi]
MDNDWNFSHTNYTNLVLAMDLRALCSHVIPSTSDLIMWENNGNNPVSISIIWDTLRKRVVQLPWTVLQASLVGFNFNWNDFLEGNIFIDRIDAVRRHVGYLYLVVAFNLIWRERNLRAHNQGLAHTAARLVGEIKAILREKLYT